MPAGVVRRLRTNPAVASILSMSFRFCSVCEEGEDLDRVTSSIVAAYQAQMSEWARFPAGPLERHL